MRQFMAFDAGGEDGVRLFEIVGNSPTASSELSSSIVEATGYRLGGQYNNGMKAVAPIDISRERRVFCLGLNYRDHAAEVDLESEEPVVFGKFGSVLADPGAVVAFPHGVEDIDYEAEIAILISSRASAVPPGRGEEFIGAFFLANDFTSRSLQFGKGGQWTLGKNLDRTTPIGPVLAVPDDWSELQGRRLRCFVNGDERQNASTSDMIFSPGRTVEYLSRFVELRVGDVILTGTPAGTAMGLPGTPYLMDGDRVTIECDGLGTLDSSVQMGGGDDGRNKG